MGPFARSEKSKRIRNHRKFTCGVSKLKIKWMQSQMKLPFDEPISMADFESKVQEAKALAEHYKSKMLEDGGLVPNPTSDGKTYETAMSGNTISEPYKRYEDLAKEIELMKILEVDAVYDKGCRLSDNLDDISQALGLTVDTEVRKTVEVVYYATLMLLVSYREAFEYSDAEAQTTMKRHLYQHTIIALQDIRKKRKAPQTEASRDLKKRVQEEMNKVVHTHSEYMVRQRLATEEDVKEIEHLMDTLGYELIGRFLKPFGLA